MPDLRTSSTSSQVTGGWPPGPIICGIGGCGGCGGIICCGTSGVGCGPGGGGSCACGAGGGNGGGAMPGGAACIIEVAEPVAAALAEAWEVALPAEALEAVASTAAVVALGFAD